MEHLRQMVNWDLTGRQGLVDERGYHIEVNEFDYKGVNQVVYEENGVTIRSFPAIHSLDGPVSFSLEWNGIKFVFGSDTYPNKWFVKYAKDADLAIHECFIAVPSLIEKFRFTPQTALTQWSLPIHLTHLVTQIRLKSRPRIQKWLPTPEMTRMSKRAY
jgi:ribonuclease Z